MTQPSAPHRSTAVWLTRLLARWLPRDAPDRRLPLLRGQFLMTCSNAPSQGGALPSPHPVILQSVVHSFRATSRRTVRTNSEVAAAPGLRSSWRCGRRITATRRLRALWLSRPEPGATLLCADLRAEPSIRIGAGTANIPACRTCRALALGPGKRPPAESGTANRRSGDGFACPRSSESRALAGWAAATEQPTTRRPSRLAQSRGRKRRAQESCSRSTR
jgi:hypothetical protein